MCFFSQKNEKTGENLSFFPNFEAKMTVFRGFFCTFAT